MSDAEAAIFVLLIAPVALILWAIAIGFASYVWKGIKDDSDKSP